MYVGSSDLIHLRYSSSALYSCAYGVRACVRGRARARVPVWLLPLFPDIPHIFEVNLEVGSCLVCLRRDDLLLPDRTFEPICQVLFLQEFVLFKSTRKECGCRIKAEKKSHVFVIFALFDVFFDLLHILLCFRDCLFHLDRTFALSLHCLKVDCLRDGCVVLLSKF